MRCKKGTLTSGFLGAPSRAEAPAGVFAGAGAYQQWDSYNIELIFVVQFKTLLFEYRCDINQAFYVTAIQNYVQNEHLQGSRYIKPTFFVTAIYTVHYKRRVHQQNPEKAVGRSWFMASFHCFAQRPS